MSAETGPFQSLSLKGEVIEILENEGHLVAKVRVGSRGMLDIDSERLRGAHLGDQLRIDALIVVEGVRPEWLSAEELDAHVIVGPAPE